MKIQAAKRLQAAGRLEQTSEMNKVKALLVKAFGKPKKEEGFKEDWLYEVYYGEYDVVMTATALTQLNTLYRMGYEVHFSGANNKGVLVSVHDNTD